MTRIKLQDFEGCMDDCLKSIALDRKNMKGYYLLAQAQLALNHPNEALTSALTAYEKCLETNDKSASAVSGLVLQAKKQKWVSYLWLIVSLLIMFWGLKTFSAL